MISYIRKYLGFILLLISVSAYAQEQDSLKQLNPFENPWEFAQPINSESVTNDSLLRWQIWPSWSDWFSTDISTISYRQGTIGRTDAYLIGGVEPRFQKHKWNDIELNDPVSGMMNLSFVPHHKLEDVRLSSTSDLTYSYSLKNYYSRVPITQLNFDESKFKYRNLEFLFARNISAKTQIELSYWDRRDGDAYARSDVEGGQVYAKLSHQFSERLLVRAHWLRNEFNNEESFGYNLIDPALFSFNRFSVSATQNGANSFVKNVVQSASLHFAPKNKTSETMKLGVYRKLDRRRLRYQADTTRYEIENLGVNFTRKINLTSNLVSSSNLRFDAFSSDDTSTIRNENWTMLTSSSSLKYELGDVLVAELNGELQIRESQSALDNSLRIRLLPKSNLIADASLSIGEQLPSIQALYWQSANYSGNENLDNETFRTLSGRIGYRIPMGLEFGAKAAYRSFENGILLDLNSGGNFTNIDQYEVLSLTPYMELNTKRWELGMSGTLTQFTSSGSTVLEQQLNNLNEFLLVRGKIYYKGPIYNSAAFIKAGFEGTMSPLEVQTFSYVPDLGYWALLNQSLPNPAYYRVDANISARIRSIFLLMRWENLFDGFGQAGYFESVGYPMPPRRLILGIRVLFKN